MEFLETADKLFKMIVDCAREDLPTARDVAKEFGVSNVII